MTVSYSPEAREDLREELDYLDERSQEAAINLSEQLDKVINDLAAGAFDGTTQQLTTGEVVQSWPVGSLRVIYQRREEVFYIVRIYHQARRPITLSPMTRRPKK